MNLPGLAFLLCLVLVSPGIALAQTVDTELSGITAELLDLRQSGGVLRLAVRLTNATADENDTSRFPIGRIVIVDAKAKSKHLPLKAADGLSVGGPFGDSQDGGRIRVHVPGKQSTIVWAYFEPVPAGSVVSVEMPLMFPFEKVAVAEGASKVLTPTSAPSTPGGVTATVVSASRADQVLTVRLRLQADRGASPELGGAYFEHKNVFVFDPASRRKYPLLKDANGQFQATPNTVKADGGSFMYDWSKATLMTLTFPAPPDAVSTVDLMLPRFAPIVGVKIEGSGGAAAGGLATAGTTLSLEGALKELDAVVTPTEIAFDLSSDVLFDLDKADLKPTAEDKLKQLLTVVNSRGAARVTVEGHTDTRGETAYNQALSERRAGSVRAWLVSHGVAGARVSATGAGESRPVKSGTTEADHQANRRVEIRIRG